MATLFAPIAECPGLEPPVGGNIARSFAPVGRYAGHWGVDFSVAVGSEVRPAAAGVVTFAGSVAEVLSVTVDHGGGLRTSYSYLNEIEVTVGQGVRGSSTLGRSGLDHDLAAVHFSVRVDGVYQDPVRWLGCFAAPHQGLSLVPILRAVRRGILGGTFDPPHLAHLFAGEAAYRDLGLDVVTFIPAGAPWQKAGRRMTSPEDRWRMTELAITDIPYFEADDREVRREGWTYTVDTLHSYPEDEQLFLILGADAARGVTTWQSAGAVLKRATIAVIPRPGVERDEVDEALEGGDVVWLETPDVRLSGTMLRRQATAGRSIRFLVRDKVWRYVLDNGIYQPETR
ncbi:MAG: nicotinate (nicotinamide) nucleotide adenylyltransferase [bacterium]|nr:nicotinate (nicotinamide) nucleotide adenylyltransferase [bacterium]